MADSEVKTEKYTGSCETHGHYTSERIHMPYGGYVHKGCPTCMTERQARRQAEEAEQKALQERQDRFADQQRLRASGVPVRFDGKTLENYRMANDKQQIAVSACRRLIDAIREKREAPNLIFIGKPGTGKSHLSCAIVSELYRSHRVCRIDLPDLIREIRATWSRKSEATESDVLDYYGGLDLLILEEVGTGSGTDDERARVFQVINRRYESMLPTVIVSNLDMVALRAEMGDRVIDRLREGDRALVAFDWDSMRGVA